jgi:hypothetical protein
MADEATGYIVETYRMIGETKFSVTLTEYKVSERAEAMREFNGLKKILDRPGERHVKMFDKATISLVYLKVIESYPE